MADNILSLHTVQGRRDQVIKYDQVMWDGPRYFSLADDVLSQNTPCRSRQVMLVRSSLAGQVMWGKDRVVRPRPL